MSTITVPFCYLDNTKYQVFDMDECGRSVESIRELKRISERPQFAYFMLIDSEIVESSCEGGFWTIWYDKDGTMHACILPGNSGEVVKEVVIDGGEPVPEDDIVYKVRCE